MRPKAITDVYNAYWKQRSLVDDEFYFGLGDRIKQRQESKVPVAGAGTVEFLGVVTAVTAGIAIWVPALRPVARMLNRAQEAAKEQLGVIE